jgi:hypothetical protein
MGFVTLLFQVIIAIPKIFGMVKSLIKTIEEHNRQVKEEEHQRALDAFKEVQSKPSVSLKEKEKKADEYLDSI